MKINTWEIYSPSPFISANDYLNVWLPNKGGPAGYHYGDFNLSSDVTSFDCLNVWLPSNGQASHYPESLYVLHESASSSLALRSSLEI